MIVLVSARFSVEQEGSMGLDVLTFPNELSEFVLLFILGNTFS